MPVCLEVDQHPLFGVLEESSSISARFVDLVRTCEFLFMTKTDR